MKTSPKSPRRWPFLVAAILAGKVPVAGKRVGVILSGGNVDPDVLAGIIQEG